MLEWSGSICVIRFHHNPPVTNLHGGMFVIKLLSHRIYFSNLPRTERVIWLCWGILFWRSATNQPSSSCPHITRKWYSHFLGFLKRSQTREEVASKTRQLVTTMANVLGTYISWLCNAVSSLVIMHLQNLNTSLGLRIFFEPLISTPPPVVVMLL